MSGSAFDTPAWSATVDQTQAAVRDLIDRLGVDAQSPVFLAGAMFGVGAAGDWLRQARKIGIVDEDVFRRYGTGLILLGEALDRMAGL